MALQPGTRLGPYEVLSLIAAGGLGAMNINGADPEGDDNQAHFTHCHWRPQQPPR